MKLNIQISKFEEINSTNSKLKELQTVSRRDEFFTVFSAYQTSGRGQVGNSWESEKDKNILLSTLLYPNFVEMKDRFLLSMTISVAVFDFLSSHLSDVEIKWPNDIMCQGQKIAGILIENTLSGNKIDWSIVGIGLNVNQTDFTSAPNATSIKTITKTEVEISGAVNTLLDAIISSYSMLYNGNYETIRKNYFNNLYRSKGFHNFSDKNGQFTAKIIDVDNSGQLSLRDINGILRKYWFKEVEFL